MESEEFQIGPEGFRSMAYYFVRAGHFNIAMKYLKDLRKDLRKERENAKRQPGDDTKNPAMTKARSMKALKK